MVDPIELLREENRRLRQALERIADHPHYGETIGHCHKFDMVGKCKCHVGVAMAALGHKSTEPNGGGE